MRGRAILLALATSIALAASTARAHHGVAAVSLAGPEGPGAALETTSPLPLPQGMLFSMAKSEYVSFQQREAAEPNNKSTSSFNMVALGYGISPWLSLYVFQPYNSKAQEGVGRNTGLGDTNVMLALALKYDQGLQLTPEKESLDDLLDWHFGLWISSTLPVGPTTARDDHGELFAPDMQTGFGEPSVALGLSTLKQIDADLTWLFEANHQHFFAHSYPTTRYQFGGETRLNTALVYRAYGSGPFRLDLSGELNGLQLQRDSEEDANGTLAPLQASGGAVLYGVAGLRASHGAFSASLGIKRALWADLNEEAEQQGSEGLERFRAFITLSYSTRP